MRANLPADVIINPEGEITDRPFPERFGIGEPNGLGERADGLEPRGGRLSWSPGDSALDGSSRFGIVVVIAIFLLHLRRRRQSSA